MIQNQRTQGNAERMVEEVPQWRQPANDNLRARASDQSSGLPSRQSALLQSVRQTLLGGSNGLFVKWSAVGSNDGLIIGSRR